MTNTKREKPSTDTLVTETTSPVTEDKFVSNRGTAFCVDTAHNGLFFIRMKAGGVAPSFCHEFFTSRTEAEKVLERYLRINDRLGNAVFPSKDK